MKLKLQYSIILCSLFFCQKLPAQCPSGYTIGGADVVTNGDFDSGNSGFSSDYGYVANGAGQTELNPEGLYSVHTNPNDLHSAFSACSDSEGTGNFLIANGSPTDNEIVWEQSVTVTAGTLYYFVCNLSSVHPDNPAELQFSVNGSLIGSVITASTTTCQWDEFYATWNSGGSTSATISIVNKNTIASGNDFAIDKISFVPCDVVLPIRLVDIGVIQETSEYVQIFWKTASETDNDYFTIERSTNGVSFQNIGEVPSAYNTSNFDVEYAFCDENPLDSKVYYRVKQTDFNGDFEYSPVIALYSFSTESIQVYSNSNQHEIIVNSKYDLTEFINISIVDNVGKVCSFKKRANNTIQIQNLSAGMYFITLQHKTGKVFCKSFCVTANSTNRN